MPDLETWENVSGGHVAVLKAGPTGRETVEIVGPYKRFSLTKEERKLNQDRAASEMLDLFQNGTLTPVRLLDGDEDAAMFASNPNMMSTSDLRNLFSIKQWKAFEGKLNEITNPMTLRRLLELSDEENTTVRQVAAINARLEKLEPEAPAEVDKIPLVPEYTRPPGVTPR